MKSMDMSLYKTKEAIGLTEPLELSDSDFIARYVQNAAQVMWFLGAGTSRTAGMPTATDIIWDLKRAYYCNEENQDIQQHDINNDSIKRKIQSYMDSKGFPALWSAEEYSFYFDLTFKTNYAEQQKYLNVQLSADKISLNIGHRVMAALLEMSKAKLVFTTNFDTVIEQAHSEVTGKALSAYHLEGSYAALSALNSENFPIYSKVHGDFRYQSIKNLTADLISNDEQIQSCFLAAATRYGLVVSGYSGRDQNVMSMFDKALEQNNPFPQGLYWTVTKPADVTDSVKALIEKARSKNVTAYIVIAGTFDILLSKIWRQVPNKPDALDKKVRTAIAKTVSIPLPRKSSNFPLLRTNALLITSAPTECASISTTTVPAYPEFREAMKAASDKVVAAKTDKILIWGNSTDALSALRAFTPSQPQRHQFDNPEQAIQQSTHIKAFYEAALANALVSGKPLKLRKDRTTFYAIIDHTQIANTALDTLKAATASYREHTGTICGSIKTGVFWSEAVSLRLEERNGLLWLLLRPDIWISPMSERQNCLEFIKGKKKQRYNRKANEFLDAWIQVLLGELGGKEIEVSCLSSSDFPAKFTINTRSAFGGKEVANG
jgi:hypothetical protein